jgi:hypothetical protein
VSKIEEYNMDIGGKRYVSEKKEEKFKKYSKMKM